MKQSNKANQKPHSYMSVSGQPNGCISKDCKRQNQNKFDFNQTNGELVCQQSRQLHHQVALQGTLDQRKLKSNNHTPHKQVGSSSHAKNANRDSIQDVETYPNSFEKLKSKTMQILEDQFYNKDENEKLDEKAIQQINNSNSKISVSDGQNQKQTCSTKSNSKSKKQSQKQSQSKKFVSSTNDMNGSAPKTTNIFEEIQKLHLGKNASDQQKQTVLGKRVKDHTLNFEESNFQHKKLKSEETKPINEPSDTKIIIQMQDSIPSDTLRGAPENPEGLGLCDQTSSENKLNQGRPKRVIKKQLNQDMVYTYDDINDGESTPDAKKNVININNLNKNTIKNIRISDNQDPFTMMYKHIMEPILQLDRLEVLRENKIEFDVKLYPKDLKNLARKDELIKSRVHIEPNITDSEDYSEMIIEINCDEDFERHSKDRESVAQPQNESDSDNNEEQEDEEMNEQKDKEIQDQASNPQLQQNKVKKRRKKGKLLCATTRRSQTQLNKKPYQTYLPHSLSDCSWLENTPKNISILDQKNNQIKLQREIKKEQDLQRLQNLYMRNKENFNKQEDCDKQEEQKITEKVKEEEENDDYEFTPRDKLNNLDQLEERFRHAYYHNLELLSEDIQNIVLKSIKTRCQNSLAKIYLTHFLIRSQEIIKHKRRDFLNKWVTYYKVKLYNNQATNCIVGNGDEQTWYKHFDETTKRQYFEIKDYKVKVPGEENFDQDQHMASDDQIFEQERIKEIMKTKKQIVCDGTCCMKPYQEVVSNNPKSHMIAQIQNEKCQCAKEKVECGPHCQCDPKKCRNRQMSENQSLIFGIDVEEKVSWGMDICTQVNFLTIMPRNIPYKIQSTFVEKKLVYAIQQQENEGYNVLKALQYILNANLNDEILQKKYNQQDIEIARVLFEAIQNLPEKNECHFKIHSKGLGIFCKRKQGIKTNSLVIEYYGEIYRPWHWFEKQDIIKQGQHAKKLPNDLPDFYNITFERHINDPDGYNILTVDPILHGNYSSRLSHSCFPNCQTINKVRNGQYSIGMFTNKEITYGEELCFDYCSFTESEKEFDSAVCLCGTAFCKGRYLNLANDKKNLGVMKNNHTFLDRNYIIYKAVCQEKLTDEDFARLHRNGLRQSALKEAPEWLKIWASLVCEYLEFEEELFPDFFSSDYPPNISLEAIKIDARFQKETQIQNIAITIDKVTHVLQQMETDEPPIVPLSYEERYNRLWVKEGCLKLSVLDVLNSIEKDKWNTQVTQANKLIDEIDNRIFIVADEANAEEEYKKRYAEVRQVLSNISDILRSVNSFKVAIPAFCDILMMYAFTTEYFTQNENYKRCKSNHVMVRRCDVKHGENTQMDKFSQGQTIYTGQKEYDSQYIWGQLVGWFKQTVNKPNASLSADRRGTLSIPDVQSFIIPPGKQVFEDTNEQKTQVKKKKAKKGKRDTEEEVMPTQGSRSRPSRSNKADESANIKNKQDQNSSPNMATEQQLVSQNQEMATAPFQSKLKIIYPSKRYSERKEFLQNWKESFSKQWDVCCEWNFQNKMKMYGSLQFESIIRADIELRQEKEIEKQIVRYKQYLENRMNFFDGIVFKLLQYNH